MKLAHRCSPQHAQHGGPRSADGPGFLVCGRPGPHSPALYNGAWGRVTDTKAQLNKHAESSSSNLPNYRRLVTQHLSPQGI